MFYPSKIIAIGLNYFDHAKEFNAPVPDHPVIFLKPPTSIIQNGDSILYPAQSSEVHFEGELGVVIKDRIKHITKDDAPGHIAGYTCANDITARDLQRLDGQWTRAKSFDTFCPLGPRIATDVNPASLRIQTRVNGEVKQDSNTRNMIFGVAYLVSFISSIMTLLPGDIIITGTPSGVGPIIPGDIVEVEIEGIGVLKNRVSERK